MKKVLKMFGRYLLLDHLAQGGMAEIFRAWAPSVDGGGRLMVLKCVQPDFGQDSEFLQMFRSEIRVSIALNHPNIVQLYDFGEAEGRPYIAMELVEGKSLKQIIQHLLRYDKKLPVEYACFAIEQVAAGLYYAHTFRDRTSGEDLNIVHRDISPQNLLVSYSGNLKIIDFGIAKATSNRQTTRAGIIKGKPSYLSPEQISGEVLDGRSDVFSLGAVFWETLTGRKLFSGDSDLAAIKLIDNCDASVTPPSTLNPEVPPEIDAIVLKSLTHDRDRRYKNAEELQRALHRAIYVYKPDFDPSNFGNYLSETFRSEIEQEHRDVQMLSNEAKHLIGEEQKVPSLTAGEKFSEEDTIGTRREAETRKTGNTGTATQTGESTPVSSGMNVPRPGGIVRSAPTPGESGSRYFDSQIIRPEVINLEIGRGNRTNTRSYQVREDDDPSASILPKVFVAILVLAGLGYYLFFPVPTKKSNHAPVAQTQSTPAAETEPTPKAIQPAAKFALLKLDISPAGGPVVLKINGRVMNASQPIQLPLGIALKFEVKKPGFNVAEKEVTLSVEGEFPLQLDLDPENYGLLTLHCTPSAKVQLLNGDWLWNVSTPVDLMKLPPGNYQARLVNDLIGIQKSVQINIPAGKKITKEVDLTQQ
jgi:serine/threonine protein kinase